MKYDLIVIGSDTAGLAVARQAAARGLAAAAVWPDSAAFVGESRFARALSELIPELAKRQSARENSWQNVRLAMAERAELVYQSDLVQLRSVGVEVFLGQPMFLDGEHLEVASDDAAVVMSAQTFVIATGTQSAVDRSAYGPLVCDTTQVLAVDATPRDLIVIGAEVLGVGMAGLFAAAGASVSVSSRDASTWTGSLESLVRATETLGVRFRQGVDVIGLSPDTASSRIRVHLDTGERVLVDHVLGTTPRVGRTESLNLAATGLVTDDTHRLWCDHEFRTWQEHIFAAGDVVGFVPQELGPEEQAAAVIQAITTAGQERRRHQPPNSLRLV